MQTDSNLEISFTKARSHILRKEFLEAEKIYQDILNKLPKNVHALKELTNLEKLKENRDSIFIPELQLNQILYLSKNGKFLDAIEEAMILVKKYPDSFMAWEVLGSLSTQIGKPDKAIEAYKQCIILKPDYANAYINIAIAYRALGKLDDSIYAYQKFILLNPKNADAYINIGNALQDQLKFEQAINFYDKALSLNPNSAQAFYNLGNAQLALHKLENAIESYNNALSINPNYIQAQNNLGVALKDQGKFEEAITAYNKAILLNPNYAQAYQNLGITLHIQGAFEDSVNAYDKAISVNPDYAEAYNNLGITLNSQSKFEDSVKAYKKAISIKPDYADAYNNLGVTLHTQGKLDKAIWAYKKAISLEPDNADTYNKIGGAFYQKGNLELSIVYFKKSIFLNPNKAETHNNLGVVLKDQGKFEEAITAYNKAILLNSNYANPCNNIGVLLQDLGKTDKAIDAYKKAILIKPDYAEAHHNLSFTLLNIGRLKEGLDESEWRWKTEKYLSKKRSFIQPMWDGTQSLKNKRILIWCEQGIGDTLNWSSLLPIVSSKTKNFTLECHEKLVSLLQRSFPNLEVKPEDRSQDMNRDDFDYHLPMGSLYKHFLEEITENPKPKAYLVPDPDRVNYWRERLKSLGKGPYIGIAWKSSSISPNRLPNYAPIHEWSPVLKIPNVTFINLQYKDFEDDLAKVREELGVTVHNFDDLDQWNNIDDVTALCAALDIVITPKITVVYMSAGVGTTTKLANWKQSYWNNLLSNPQSSSVNLFERNTWEPWDKVFNLIREDIFKVQNKTLNRMDRI